MPCYIVMRPGICVEDDESKLRRMTGLDDQLSVLFAGVAPPPGQFTNTGLKNRNQK